MKLELISIILILFFSVLINADENLYNQKRYLQSSIADKQLLLLGFEDFKVQNITKTPISQSLSFCPVFEIYGDIENLKPYNVTLNYTTNMKYQVTANVTCKESSTQLSEFIEGCCSLSDISLNDGDEIKLVKLINFPNEIDKIKVQKSAPAKKLMENLKNANISDMVVFHFHLIEVAIKEKEVILEGNITSPDNPNEKTAILTFNDTDYNCTITYSRDKAYTHEISFYPKENMTMNESLDHQVMDLDGKGRVILFVTDYALNKRIVFPENTTYDDQIKNHTKTNQFLVDLLGFQDFVEESDGPARGKAYFRGTFDSLIELKKYIKVNVQVTNNTRLLRSLADEEVKYENITAIGKKIENFDDIESKTKN